MFFFLLRGDFNDFCLAFLHILYPLRWTNDSTWLYNIYMNFQLGCFNHQNILTYFDIEKYQQFNLAGPFLQTCLDHPCAESEKAPPFLHTDRYRQNHHTVLCPCKLLHRRSATCRSSSRAELKSIQIGWIFVHPKALWVCDLANYGKKKCFWPVKFRDVTKWHISWIIDSWIDLFSCTRIFYRSKNDYIWLLFNVQLWRNSSIIKGKWRWALCEPSHVFKETTNMRIYI